jgi:hypothetical protein
VKSTGSRNTYLAAKSRRITDRGPRKALGGSEQAILVVI